VIKLSRRREEETKKEMIKAFARRGISPTAIKNDSEDCKNQAKDLGKMGVTSDEIKDEYWACMADKLEGETRSAKRRKYFNTP